MARDPMFPLAGPTVEDGAITVDLMLNEPKRIDNYISTMVEKNLLSKLIYGNVTTSGGALLFDQLVKNEATASSKPGVVAPGGEFPILSTPDGEPQVVKVQKTGGKFGVTDEARTRNDMTMLQRKGRQVANTMVVDLDRRGIAALDNALTTIDGALSVASGGWAAATGVTVSEKTAKKAEGEIISNLLDAQLAVEETELGYKLDTLLLNPKDAKNLKLLFGVANYGEMLANFDLSLRTSSAVNEGEGMVLQAGMVGVMGVESPISTETWREPKNQTTWSQTWATVAFGITDPFAMVKITGLKS